MASSDDDPDFQYVKTRRTPVEHEETSQSGRDAVSGRNTGLSSTQISFATQDLIQPFTGLLRPKSQVNCRVLAEYLGRVVYNDPSLLCHFAVYWALQGERAKKYKRLKSTSDMVVDAEGIILNRSMILNRNDTYYYPEYYRRLRTSINDANASLMASSISGRCASVGQFGTVYHAVDIASENTGAPLRFAEKVIHLDQFNKNELEILCSIRHQHIVQVYGAIRTKDGIHIFMHLGAGGSVARLIKKGCGLPSDGNNCPHLFTEYWGMKYFSQVLSALCYLKTKKIVHCDVKPRNVVLSSDYQHCFLLDFGEALTVPQGKDFVELKDGAVGTEHFMSPEQIEYVKFHYQSDLWSASCFLLNILTGYTPWTIAYADLSTYMYAITRKPYKIVDEIPEWTCSITKSLLKSCFVEIHKRKHVEEVCELSNKALFIITEEFKRKSNMRPNGVVSPQSKNNVNPQPEVLLSQTESNHQTNVDGDVRENGEAQLVNGEAHPATEIDKVKFGTCTHTRLNAIESCKEHLSDVVQSVSDDLNYLTIEPTDATNNQDRESMEELARLIEENEHLLD